MRSQLSPITGQTMITETAAGRRCCFGRTVAAGRAGRSDGAGPDSTGGRGWRIGRVRRGGWGVATVPVAGLVASGLAWNPGYVPQPGLAARPEPQLWHRAGALTPAMSHHRGFPNAP